MFRGESRPALRRIAEFGQGWNAAIKTPEQRGKPPAELDEMLSENGRTRYDLEITIMPDVELTKDDREDYREVGVDQIAAFEAAASADQFRSECEPIAKVLVVPASSGQERRCRPPSR